jgi:hypothetical protein
MQLALRVPVPFNFPEISNDSFPETSSVPATIRFKLSILYKIYFSLSPSIPKTSHSYSSTGVSLSVGAIRT